MFTQPLPERWIRFEGLNTADGNREVVIDLYRVAINPAKELSIITDELLKFELSGQVLADLTKPVGGDLGQPGGNGGVALCGGVPRPGGPLLLDQHERTVKVRDVHARTDVLLGNAAQA